MKKRILTMATVGVMGLITLTGCTTLDDMNKDRESNTKGLKRVITVYSKTGEVIKKYEGDRVRTEETEGGQVVVNINGKRIQILNADTIIEEK